MQVLKRHSVCNFIWELIQTPTTPSVDEENKNTDGEERKNTDGEERKRQEQKEEEDKHRFLSQAVKARLTIEYEKLKKNHEEIFNFQGSGVFIANFEFKDVQVS